MDGTEDENEEQRVLVYNLCVGREERDIFVRDRETLRGSTHRRA